MPPAPSTAASAAAASPAVQNSAAAGKRPRAAPPSRLFSQISDGVAFVIVLVAVYYIGIHSQFSGSPGAAAKTKTSAQPVAPAPPTAHASASSHTNAAVHPRSAQHADARRSGQSLFASMFGHDDAGSESKNGGNPLPKQQQPSVSQNNHPQTQKQTPPLPQQQQQQPQQQPPQKSAQTDKPPEQPFSWDITSWKIFADDDIDLTVGSIISVFTIPNLEPVADNSNSGDGAVVTDDMARLAEMLAHADRIRRGDKGGESDEIAQQIARLTKMLEARRASTSSPSGRKRGAAESDGSLSVRDLLATLLAEGAEPGPSRATPSDDIYASLMEAIGRGFLADQLDGDAPGDSQRSQKSPPTDANAIQSAAANVVSVLSKFLAETQNQEIEAQRSTSNKRTAQAESLGRSPGASRADDKKRQSSSAHGETPRSSGGKADPARGSRSASKDFNVLKALAGILADSDAAQVDASPLMSTGVQKLVSTFFDMLPLADADASGADGASPKLSSKAAPNGHTSQAGDDVVGLAQESLSQLAAQISGAFEGFRSLLTDKPPAGGATNKPAASSSTGVKEDPIDALLKLVWSKQEKKNIGSFDTWADGIKAILADTQSEISPSGIKQASGSHLAWKPSTLFGAGILADDLSGMAIDSDVASTMAASLGSLGSLLAVSSSESGPKRGISAWLHALGSGGLGGFLADETAGQTMEIGTAKRIMNSLKSLLAEGTATAGASTATASNTATLSSGGFLADQSAHEMADSTMANLVMESFRSLLAESTATSPGPATATAQPSGANGFLADDGAGLLVDGDLAERILASLKSILAEGASNARPTAAPAQAHGGDKAQHQRKSHEPQQKEPTQNPLAAPFGLDGDVGAKMWAAVMGLLADKDLVRAADFKARGTPGDSGTTESGPDSGKLAEKHEIDPDTVRKIISAISSMLPEPSGISTPPPSQSPSQPQPQSQPQPMPEGVKAAAAADTNRDVPDPMAQMWRSMERFLAEQQA
ncbi:hypothetical protein HK105_204368 [Polyrhizophydium stewartii]|uniref:Uncharacterized protein n=1 Tax=Polyrhizophydium stewartii TaxID=2732419 RepID=A0ABR4N8U3_9FUNG